MNEAVTRRCEQLIANRDRMKAVFSWDGGTMNLCSAAICMDANQVIDEETLERCKQLLKEKVGVFSNFRSTAKSAIVAIIAVSGNPERTLDRGLLVYDLLKKEFRNSTYLPMVAMMIAQVKTEDEFAPIVARTKSIYRLIKENHPFLTSSEDCAFCALMALSDKTDQELVEDAERCYQILKPSFFSSNAVQSLSHVLALGEGAPEVKCEKTLELFFKLKEAGYRYGTEYELPTLGVLAMTGATVSQLVADMIEIDTWLANQKGFGFFSSITKKQRLMYAGMIEQKEYVSSNAMRVSAINGTISMIIAQQVAMCAAVGASAAAAASSSAN